MAAKRRGQERAVYASVARVACAVAAIGLAALAEDVARLSEPLPAALVGGVGRASSLQAVTPSHRERHRVLRHGGARTVSRRASAGDEIGGLVLEERLGAGGFGAAWSARPSQDASDELRDVEAVAVKLVRLEDGWGSLDRLEREAAVLARLRHPGIPRYYGSVSRDRPDGRDFGLVSDLVRGQTLDALVRNGKWRAEPVEVRGLATALLEVCEHLASFAPPVVHRDIKPANVVLESRDATTSAQPSWRPFLVDFGAAVLGSGARTTAVGTFGFMAPETFGQVFTPKSDLYGVGATVLFAVTGREPGSFPQERLQVQFREGLVGTPWEREEPWLAELLDRLLAPAPEDRFASATEALRFLHGDTTVAPRETTVAPRDVVAIPAPTRLEDGDLQPPRGSALNALRSGFELRVLMPPPSLSSALPNGVFGVAWTAFTAFWTSSVLAAGAPVMALFSLPFWGVGGSLISDTVKPFLRGGTQLSIGRESWRLERTSKSEEPIAEGRTSDLKCYLATTAVVNGREVLCTTLEEGLLEQRCGEGLRPQEHEWLVKVISEHLDRCREGRPS